MPNEFHVKSFITHHMNKTCIFKMIQMKDISLLNLSCTKLHLSDGLYLAAMQ